MKFSGEVLTFWLGQCGVQMSDAFWELLCLEHQLGPDGKLSNQEADDMSFKYFFFEGVDNQFVPRTIIFDSEPTVVDEIRTGVYRNLFHPNYMISYFEDASNNYAKGFHLIGKYNIDNIARATRKISETCDMVQAMILNNSYGGGTGSGFSSALLDYLTVEYAKISKIQISVFPSPTLSTAVVEPYNAALSIHSPIEKSDLSILLDNEALFNICEFKLNIERPVFTNLNRLVAQIYSGLTAAFRFVGPANTKLIDLQTNLVPFPKIHFPTISYAPIENPYKVTHEKITTKEITLASLTKRNQLLMTDPNEGIKIACVFLYRGDVNSREINTTLSALKISGKMSFFDWSPTGFKTGINYQPMTSIPPSGMAFSPKSVTVLVNSTSFKSVLARLNQKFSILFNKRAFVHWFIGEGMEEGEFNEAWETIVYFEQDYNSLEESSDKIEKGGKYTEDIPPLQSHKLTENKESLKDFSSSSLSKKSSHDSPLLNKIVSKTHSEDTEDIKDDSDSSDENTSYTSTTASTSSANKTKTKSNI